MFQSLREATRSSITLAETGSWAGEEAYEYIFSHTWMQREI